MAEGTRINLIFCLSHHYGAFDQYQRVVLHWEKESSSGLQKEMYCFITKVALTNDLFVFISMAIFPRNTTQREEAEKFASV